MSGPLIARRAYSKSRQSRRIALIQQNNRDLEHVARGTNFPVSLFDWALVPV